MMKNLNLSLKPIYYDMIAKGLKKYEYREITDYYIQRLTSDNRYVEGKEPNWADYSTVTFYCKHGNRPPMTYQIIKYSLYPEVKPKYFTIHLGELVKKG